MGDLIGENGNMAHLRQAESHSRSEVKLVKTEPEPQFSGQTLILKSVAES